MDAQTLAAAARQAIALDRCLGLRMGPETPTRERVAVVREMDAVMRQFVKNLEATFGKAAKGPRSYPP